MLRRKYSPHTGYALYFPEQPGIEKDGRVLFGQYLRTWRRYDFKHVQLGTFSVQVTYRADKDRRTLLPKTKDGFPCEVDALFTVEVIATPTKMKEATKNVPAGDTLANTVKHQYFIDELLPELQAVVNTSLENLQLLKNGKPGESPESTGVKSLQGAKAEIQTLASSKLHERGFELKAGFLQLDIRPQEPDLAARAANPELEKAWQRFAAGVEIVEREDKKRKDEAEIQVEVQRQRLVIDRDREISELNDKAAEEQAKQNEKRQRSQLERAMAFAAIKEEKEEADARIREQTRARELEDAENKAKHEQRLAAIEEEKVKRQRQVEIENAQAQAEKERELKEIERKRASEARAAELAESEEKANIDQQKYNLAMEQVKRDYEEGKRKRQEQLDQSKHGLELANLRAQLTEINAKLVPLKKMEIESIGQAEAKVAEAKAMAVNAHAVHMHDKLIEALPQMLEKASLAGSSLGEVRVLYMGGGSYDGDASHQSGIGQELHNLISSLSSVSLLREMLRFISDLPELIEQPGNERSAGKGATELKPAQPHISPHITSLGDGSDADPVLEKVV